MKAQFLAPAVGIVAVLLLAAAYFAPPYLGLPVDPAKVLAVGVILAAGASLAALVFAAMNPAGPMRGALTTHSPLNEPPVLPFIAMFHEPGVPTTTVTVTPGDMATDILSRHGDFLKEPEKNGNKRMLLVLKAGRKKFNPLEIKTVFSALASYPRFYHVLLHDENDKFVAYLPVDGCRKDFTGENGESRITKCVVDVLADPKFKADPENKRRELLYSLKGATSDDMAEETMDIRDAAGKMRENEKLQTLIVTRKLKPIGVLDKQSVLTLTSTGA